MEIAVAAVVAIVMFLIGFAIGRAFGKDNRQPIPGEPEPIVMWQEHIRLETIKSVHRIDKSDERYSLPVIRAVIKKHLLSELVEYADKIGAVTYVEEPDFYEPAMSRITAYLRVGIK